MDMKKYRMYEGAITEPRKEKKHELFLHLKSTQTDTPLPNIKIFPRV